LSYAQADEVTAMRASVAGSENRKTVDEVTPPAKPIRFASTEKILDLLTEIFERIRRGRSIRNGRGRNREEISFGHCIEPRKAQGAAIFEVAAAGSQSSKNATPRGSRQRGTGRR
jgi:hypothetical protein